MWADISLCVCVFFFFNKMTCTWTEVQNIVQEVANKTIPKKNKSKTAKWLSEEALWIAEEQREAKSKGERERSIQLSAEFQRIARRDKKALFNEQCLIIE